MTVTTTRPASAPAAPLTVRIIDGRLHLCAPTRDLLTGPAGDVPVESGALRIVPVMLDDGSAGRWYGAPVVGALALVRWLVDRRASVDVTVTAIASLVVEAAE
ncbi:MAG: hypothetical protein JOZ99_11720, partial [Actinobacteria bacterium]|nr:hypothetical protein [Actinomycetota bacterium]